MKDTKKSRPGVSSTRTAAEPGANNHENPESHLNSTTAAAVRQIKIKDFLLAGAENAIPRRHLRQLTGLSDRELRKRIELERREGAAICSDNLTGYYLAGSEFEKRRFVNSMLHRAAEISKTAAAVGQAEV